MQAYPGCRTMKSRGMGVAALVAGGLDVLFWILYSVSSSTRDPIIGAYEGAFPIADAILGICLLGAGLALIRGSALGPFLLIAAAGASLYLGIIDVTFYAKEGAYAHRSLEVLVEIIVNVATIGGGILGLAFGWRRWRAR